MLAAERQSRIADQVQRHGSARVAELANLLDASEMTIRRDLDVLHDSGAVVKVHGGATTARSSHEPGFDTKSVRNRAEKAAIARAAAQFAQPGMSVGMSAGTTTWALAHELAGIRDLTVVTNSLRIADVLHQAPPPSPSVVVTGGVRTPSDALVGPIATSSIRQLNLDVVFLGVHGLSQRAGLSTPNLHEADTNRAFAESAAKLVVIADHTKWGTVGLSTIVPLDRADVLVTDAGISQEAHDTLAGDVGQVVIASAPPSLRAYESANEAKQR